MDDYLVDQSDEASHFASAHEAFRLGNEQAALDIIGVCVGSGKSNLLLDYRNLIPAFFDLRTGNAGAVIQKFVMYGIRVAAVVPVEKIVGRFREMVIELNRGDHFRIFETKEQAVRWLHNFEERSP